MSLSSKEFANVPRTIFDQDDGDDLDVSEEMEEIRELLYELIKSNFSTGVMVEHLAKVYNESYESVGMGPPLPSNWLEHIRMADEFEVVNRGPIVMVYTRQRNTPAIKLDAIPSTNLKISKSYLPEEKKETVRIRLTDRELAQQMKPITVFESITCPCNISVVVVSYDHTINDVILQMAKSRSNFEQMQSLMHTHYENLGLGEPVNNPEIDGIYALRDTDGQWYRALLQDMNDDLLLCTLVDVGKCVSVAQAEIRRLKAEFALPRIYPIYAISARIDPTADQGTSISSIHTALCTKQPITLRFISRDAYKDVYNVQCINFSISEGIPVISPKSTSPMPFVPTQFVLPPTDKDLQLLPMECKEMPRTKFAAHVLAVFDSDNISIRQCSLDPIPDYISSAVQKDSLSQSSPPLFGDFIVGRFFAAKLQSDTPWERVLLLGPSTIDADCFRVYAVDIGAFGIARKHSFRHLKLAPGLRKILMAKCRISAIKPADGSDIWCRESQLFLTKILCSAKNVEVEPIGDWSKFAEPNTVTVPFANVRLFADGKNVAEYLVDQGFARFV